MADDTGKEEHEDEPVEDEDTSSEQTSYVEDQDDDAKPEVTAAAADGDGEYGGERSEMDAMGNDKRREVVGQQYGATLRKRLLVYGGVVGVGILVVIAFLTVVKGYDQRDLPLKNTAPWTEAGAPQVPPRDVDFKANGPTDTIPANQIFEH